MQTALVHDRGFQYQAPFVWNWLPLKGCSHRHDGLFATPKASRGPLHNRQREVVWRNSPSSPPPPTHPPTPALSRAVTSGLLKSSISSSLEEFHLLSFLSGRLDITRTCDCRWGFKRSRCLYLSADQSSDTAWVFLVLKLGAVCFVCV